MQSLRLGHWALEGLMLWEGFGLGGLTMLLTAGTFWGSPSMMAKSANERVSRILGGEGSYPRPL